MKRSSELAVLSREHHVALEVALRLQRVSAEDEEAVAGDVLGFWADEGREHFRLEEEILLPVFIRHVGADDGDVVRLLAEHEDIRRRIGQIHAGAHDRARLKELGEALRDHVRHEERTVFARVEETLTAQELDEVGAALHAAGPRRERREPPARNGPATQLRSHPMATTEPQPPAASPEVLPALSALVARGALVAPVQRLSEVLAAHPPIAVTTGQAGTRALHDQRY